jgi:hypothetical protein
LFLPAVGTRNQLQHEACLNALLYAVTGSVATPRFLQAMQAIGIRTTERGIAQITPPSLSQSGFRQFYAFSDTGLEADRPFWRP